jgi:hypothetical protein
MTLSITLSGGQTVNSFLTIGDRFDAAFAALIEIQDADSWRRKIDVLSFWQLVSTFEDVIDSSRSWDKLACSSISTGIVMEMYRTPPTTSVRRKPPRKIYRLTC